MEKGMSIIIPAYGRVKLLCSLLDSIYKDILNCSFDVEVLLIDDSLLDDKKVIRNYAEKKGARVYDSPTSNVGGKRNYGVEKSNYEIILFLDSDVVILPGTLQAHFDKLSSSNENIAACLGNVVFIGEKTFAWDVIESMQLSLPFEYPNIFSQVPWGPTANLSVRRSAFKMVGGFDTTLYRYGGEDVDLGFRWSDSGMKIITEPLAVAEHSTQTWGTWKQNIMRLWSFGTADYHLLIRHPKRSFLDFPTAPMLWLCQLVILIQLLCANLVMLSTAIIAFVLSSMAYIVVYALIKSRERQGFWRHLFGPIIFWIMDAGKIYEAVLHKQFSIIPRRVYYLDDLIDQDWPEIRATAWALLASEIVFVLKVLL